MKNEHDKVVLETHNDPYGVLVAMNLGGVLHTGYSLCCKKDHFEKSWGKWVASERARKHEGLKASAKWPEDVIAAWGRFADRMRKYYKLDDNDEIPDLTTEELLARSEMSDSEFLAAHQQDLLDNGLRP